MELEVSDCDAAAESKAISHLETYIIERLTTETKALLIPVIRLTKTETTNCTTLKPILKQNKLNHASSSCSVRVAFVVATIIVIAPAFFHICRCLLWVAIN